MNADPLKIVIRDVKCIKIINITQTRETPSILKIEQHLIS